MTENPSSFIILTVPKDAYKGEVKKGTQSTHTQ